MSLRKLKYVGNKEGKQTYTFSYCKKFLSLGTIEPEYVLASYAFAYSMSFTEDGHHRRKRSGGSQHRKNVEVFCNTFLGKLGEFAIYQYFKKHNIEFDYPDVKIMGEGHWDNYDFQYKERKIGVKSTKSYGHLMLLETRDWNSEAEYIPNIENENANAKYDEILFVRIETKLSNRLRVKRKYYNNEIDLKELHSEILKDSYNFDIHYTPIELIKEAMRQKIIIKKNNYLNKTKIDAENYYIQSGNMKDVRDYINKLKL